MTFADAKNLPVSNKIILLELDLPIKGEGKVPFLLNKRAGIWSYIITPEYVMTFPGGVLTMVENPVPDDGYDVGSVKVNSIDYTKVYSTADLIAQDESFMYDRDTTEIYFHFSNFHQPYSNCSIRKIIIGQTHGFCNKPDSVNGCVFDGVEYEPRIISVPSFSKNKDPLFWGYIQTPGGTMSLQNKDGALDSYKALNMQRQRMAIKLGFDGLDYEEYYQCTTAYVEKYNWDWNKFDISFMNIRKGLTKSIPPNTFTKTEFPDLDDNDVDKVKPLAWGTIRNAPTICVNSADEEAASYTFFIADTEMHDLTSVDAVYLDGELIDPSDYDIDLEAGTVEIATADVVGLEDNLDAITVDFVGADYSNSAEIIRVVMDDYNNLEYISANYNTTEYTETEALCRDIGVYLDEAIELKKFIEKRCVDSDMIFFDQNDGKYSARVYDVDRVPVKTIYSDEWIDKSPPSSIDPTRFLSHCTVKYNKDIANDHYQQYINMDYYDEVKLLYKTEQHKEFETALVSEADAIDKSEAIMLQSKFIPEEIKRKTKIQNIDLTIGDFIIASPQTRLLRPDVWGVWEIIGINPNLSKYEVELNMKWVKVYNA